MEEKDDVAAARQASGSGPLDGLTGRDRWVEFAAMRCANMDARLWELCTETQKVRYREYAEAVAMALPMHIGGELWQYVESKPPWTNHSAEGKERSDP